MTLLRRYPAVAATLGAGAIVAVLFAAGQPAAAAWLASAFSLAAAVVRSIAMVRQFVHGRWGIDLLAVAAIVSTVLVGEYIASLIIVLMLSGGIALEDFAQGRAARELTALMDRAPRTAHRELPGPALMDVPVGEVAPDDVLLVKPSEVIPVDGELLSTAGVFDESMLTGESLPVEHLAGDRILSGSVNGDQAVRIRAGATAADSQYSRIVALVREASASRAPVVRLADRYAVPFTAGSFVLAGLAWYLSGDPDRFAQVLVLATPCPLLIAAPVAFLAGMSRAAAAGIIVKTGGTLETLANVRSAVFDKTGTLTAGRPTLHGVMVAVDAPDMSGDRLLQLAASAEQYSSHVLAKSVIEAARARNIPLLAASDASEHATEGVAARCGGQSVVVGKPGFVRSVTTGFDPPQLAAGQLGIHVGVDGRYAGSLVMSDPVRSEAVETLAMLRRLGVRHTVMLTGDVSSTARHVAAELGITSLHADCLPAEKVEAVAALSLRPVMMVGDGVNDAPVLAAADVGIAMGAKGSTAASESADVVIMLDDLARCALAVGIGKRTLSIAKQSIFAGMLVSVVLMCIAAYGGIPVVAGALLQEFVDLATILNALRALRARAPEAGLSALSPGRFLTQSGKGQARHGRQWASVSGRAHARMVGGGSGNDREPPAQGR